MSILGFVGLVAGTTSVPLLSACRAKQVSQTSDKVSAIEGVSASAGQVSGPGLARVTPQTSGAAGETGAAPTRWSGEVDHPERGSSTTRHDGGPSAGSTEPAQRGRSAAVRAAVVAALAIAMGSLFLASYILALGDPVPHRIDAAIVGDPSSHQDVVAEVERVAGGGVDFHPSPSVAAALRAIDGQQVYVALDVTPPIPHLYVASAAGASVARVFASVSAADPQIRVMDTHPLPPSDPQGLDVFYLVLAATILGFLTVFQARMNAGGLSLRNWTVFVLSFALAASLVLVLVTGPLLHRLALPLLESWAILALQLITVAAFASTMAVLIGRWAIMPTFLLFVVLGNASSGGAVAPPLLPRPFAIVSQWLPSGVTVTALRDATYFHSYQQVRPVAVLAVWAVTSLAAMLVLSHRRRASPGVP